MNKNTEKFIHAFYEYLKTIINDNEFYTYTCTVKLEKDGGFFHAGECLTRGVINNDANTVSGVMDKIGRETMSEFNEKAKYEEIKSDIKEL